MPDLFELFKHAVSWAAADGAIPVWLALGGILALTGVGLPMPEDIWLTLAGFLAYQSGFFGSDPGVGGYTSHHFALAFLYVCACILAGDAVCWMLGRRFGLPLRERFGLFRRILTDARLIRVKRWYDTFGGGAVFAARMVAGVRFVAFFTAGVVHMRFWRFIFWDAMGCLASIPIWFVLGALGNKHFDKLEAWMKSLGTGFMIFGALLVVGFVLYLKVFRRKRAAVPIPPDELQRELENLRDRFRK